jgi:hypothetical protein
MNIEFRMLLRIKEADFCVIFSYAPLKPLSVVEQMSEEHIYICTPETA